MPWRIERIRDSLYAKKCKIECTFYQSDTVSKIWNNHFQRFLQKLSYLTVSTYCLTLSTSQFQLLFNPNFDSFTFLLEFFLRFIISLFLFFHDWDVNTIDWKTFFHRPMLRIFDWLSCMLSRVFRLHSTEEENNGNASL